jgi:adenylate cyclase
MNDEQPDVFEQLEEVLLGSARSYNRLEVVERSGVPLDRAEQLWRSLGFASVADDEVVFGDSDVEALVSIAALVDEGVVPAGSEGGLARSLGQAMSRLADWQTSMLRGTLVTSEGGVHGEDDPLQLAADLVPVMEKLQTYVWRRHLVAAAARMLPVAADDPRSDTVVVGFADIVGFTKLSRSVSERDLAALVELFEATTSDIIAEHGGRVVKTIGDEVLFVVKGPTQAADIALSLTAWVVGTDDVPKLRIGMAHGRVISSLGDVYGPIVNVAARLTSVARPGSTVVDRDLAAALKGEPAYRVRKIRRVAVRGYDHLEPWLLRAGD